jgi:hypothetical protein
VIDYRWLGWAHPLARSLAGLGGTLWFHASAAHPLIHLPARGSCIVRSGVRTRRRRGLAAAAAATCCLLQRAAPRFALRAPSPCPRRPRRPRLGEKPLLGLPRQGPSVAAPRGLLGRVRCVSIFLDKNRRYIGKSQPKRPPKRTQRTPHLGRVALQRPQRQHERQHHHHGAAREHRSGEVLLGVVVVLLVDAATPPRTVPVLV